MGQQQSETPNTPQISEYDRFIEQANVHLGKNEISEAYPFVSKAAQCAEASEATLVNAGLLAVSLGKLNEAVEYFNNALNKNPHNNETRYNLALANVNRGAYANALSHLQQLLEENPHQPDLHNDVAIINLRQEKSALAFEHFDKALSLDPNYSVSIKNRLQFYLENEMFAEAIEWLKQYQSKTALTTKTKLELKHWGEIFEKCMSGPVAEPEDKRHIPQIKNARIAIFAGMRTFIDDIATYLKEENEVRYFEGKDIRDLLQMMEWADIAWFEWCDQLLIEATKLPKVTKIICRLHSYEIFTNMPEQIDWDKVDQLVFVNQSVKELYERKFSNNVAKTVIYNGVDSHAFTLNPQKTYGKKIASVGYINYKKNPALLLYVFKKIHEYDNEFSLHIAGTHQDPRLELYFEHFLKEHPLPVYFDGWVDDMPAWYADKDYIISTSLFESFHYSIAEGMLCGLLPLIHRWFGADYLYPKRHLFSDPDDCLQLMMRYDKLDKKEIAIGNRAYIIDNFDITDKHREISELLHSWQKRIE